MGLFRKREEFEDSVYARRVARGEVSEIPVLLHKANEVHQLRREVKELAEENRQLKKQIEEYQEEMTRSAFVHSMDDLIDAMRQDNEKPSIASSSLSALLGWKPSAASDDGGTSNMLLPENYIRAVNTDISEFADEYKEVDWSDMDEMDQR